MKAGKTQKKMIAILVLLMVLILLLCVLMVIGSSRTEQTEPITAVVQETELPSGHVTNTEISSAGGIEILHSHVPWGSPRRPGEIREIRYITIHETDNRRAGADAEAHSSLLSTDTTDITGWHYTVDDSVICHHIPDNEIAWNAGDNRSKDGGNINGIGIEMCVNVTNDFEQTLRNTAALTAELMIAYDLSMDRVKFHEDFMVKECPHRLISEGRKEEFLQMIRDAYTARREMEQAQTESEAQ
jgi:N-acetylmuramoyl-L-alanine amidase